LILYNNGSAEKIMQCLSVFGEKGKEITDDKDISTQYLGDIAYY
jgi:hypothetical protein